MSQRKVKRQFNISLLNDYIIENSATLIGKYENLNRESNIHFTCRCGVECSKLFRYITDYGGALCESCKKISRVEKYSITRIDKIDIEESLLKKYPTIASQWHPTKNGDLKPDMFTPGSGKDIWWLCPNKCPNGCLHEWLASISTRQKSGCPYCCTPLKKICEHISIAYTHPDIAKDWHPIKNGDLKPNMFHSGSTKKVWWKCPNTCSQGCIHEYESMISKRCNEETGCVYCCNPVKKICEHMSIAYTHPDIAKDWHPTKNGDLKPTDVPSGSGLKVWWLCPKTCAYGCLHEYQSIIAQRCAKNTQCQFCIHNPMKICEHMSIVYTNPDIAKYWHPSKNGSIKASEVTSGCHKKVWWQCPNKCSHGCNHDFERSVYHMTSSDKLCPYCTNRKICEHMSLAYTHPEIAKEWHSTKNGDLKATDISYGSNQSVWWKCSKNEEHQWQNQIVLRSTSERGCPSCSKGGVSKGQVKWLEYIQKRDDIDIIFKGGRHNREESFRLEGKLFRADGYCKKENKIFEFLGCWYHGCPKCIDKDYIHPWIKRPAYDLYKDFQERKLIYEKHGYILEYIWECEWNTFSKDIIPSSEVLLNTP